MRRSQLTGMRAFSLVWFGQVISLTGSSMTLFGLTIWAFQLTGQATALALVAFFGFAPAVLVSPIAGVLVDRWNRKLVMMLSDLGAGAATIVVFILYATGSLQLWHLYAAAAFSGVFQSFQFPAYSAAISMMLPRSQYARAQGMITLADSGSGILAPILAGALLGVIGLAGIMIIDIVTFTFAIGALLLVHIPQPARTEEGRQGQGSILREAAYGFQYIWARPSLLGLLMTFLFINLTGSVSFPLVAPMVLARTGSNELVLGGVQSAGALGGVLGGVLLTAWGGPKRRVHGVLLGMAVTGALTCVLGLGLTPFVWGARPTCRAGSSPPGGSWRRFSARWVC
jgi:DHA3 family macrolide efflux protein-like MFS transporter